MLKIAEMKFLRNITGYLLMNRKRDKEIRETCELQDRHVTTI